MKTYQFKDIFDQDENFIQMQIVFVENDFRLPLETLLHKGIHSYRHQVNDMREGMDLYCKLIVEVWEQYENVCSKIIRECQLGPTPHTDLIESLRRLHIDKRYFSEKSKELRKLYHQINLVENETLASLCLWAKEKYDIAVEYFPHGEIQLPERFTALDVDQNRDHLLDTEFCIRIKTEAFRMLLKRVLRLNWSSPISLMNCLEHQMNSLETSIKKYQKDFELGVNLFFILTLDLNEGFRNV